MNLKTILLTILMVCLYGVANAQYRALTVSANSGIGLTDQTTFYGASTYLHYDVNDNWFISNWTGISYDIENPYQQWASSEVSANKYLSETVSIGTGLQYRYTFEENDNDVYVIIKFSKTLRFN